MGRAGLDRFKAALRPDTILASVMLVNNQVQRQMLALHLRVGVERAQYFGGDRRVLGD